MLPKVYVGQFQDEVIREYRVQGCVDKASVNKTMSEWRCRRKIIIAINQHHRLVQFVFSSCPVVLCIYPVSLSFYMLPKKFKHKKQFSQQIRIWQCRGRESTFRPLFLYKKYSTHFCTCDSNLPGPPRCKPASGCEGGTRNVFPLRLYIAEVLRKSGLRIKPKAYTRVQCPQLRLQC